MGRRTGQATPTSTPAARRKRSSPVLVLVRALLTIIFLGIALVLLGGWYFSGQIESGALEPPKPGPPDYEWTVDAGGASVTLTAPSGTDQGGEFGKSGLWWENGYSQSSDLLGTQDEGGTLTDVRSLEQGEQAPAVGTELKVDMYFWRGDPMTAHGLEFETVYYTSNVGTFPAWFIPPASAIGPNADTWAIFVHGKGGTLEESLRMAPILHELGYPIMVINYRNDVGEARDPSGYHQYGQTEWVDLASAVRYARDEGGATGHILIGYSFGGSVVTNYLIQSPLRNFAKAAILDSPLLSFEDTVDFRGEQATVPLLGFSVPDVVINTAKWIAAWRYDIDWEATNYLTQTANIHSPLLIFHGSEDVSVPLETSKIMATTRPDITELIVTDAGHTRSWNIDDEAYAAAIREFLAGLD